MSWIRLLSEAVRQNKLLEKRVARLETLEGLSFAAGGWTEIETIIQTDDTETIFTFDNIPQIFLHLVLIFSLRGYTGAEGVEFLISQINDDTDDHYWSILEGIWMDAAAGACNQFCTAYFPTKAGQWFILRYPNPGDEAGNDPNTFCAGHMWMPDYRNSYIKKAFVADNYFPQAQGEWLSVPTDRMIHREQSGGTWHDTDPITKIIFRSPGNRAFARNSKISLYGIGGTFEEFA